MPLMRLLFRFDVIPSHTIIIRCSETTARVSFQASQFPELAFILKCEITKSKAKRSFMLEKDYVGFPLVSIEEVPYNGLVYGLEVENNNSYMTSCFAMQGCQSDPIEICAAKNIEIEKI